MSKFNRRYSGRMTRDSGSGRGRLGRVVAVLILVVVVVGAVVLSQWEIPPPTEPVEIVIPNDRLPQ